MHVAAWHRRTLGSKFTKFGEEMSISQTPNHAKFCGDPTRSVQDIRDRKFVLPKKWANMHQNHLRSATLSPSFQISSKSVKPPWKKGLTKMFTPFNILAPQGDHLGQRSPVWMVGYTNPPLATCKISSRSDDRFVDFLAGVTHKKTHKNIQ